ncbi:MAG: hypothetical protein JST90_15945 [Bacteroidetes bacterium]|nr:hypothetical protein [Bacteroidota bacterium]
MRKTKQTSSVWAYLTKLEGYDHFTEDEVKIAKQTYWKYYDKRRQAKKRKEKREIVLIFPASDIKIIRATAKTLGYSIHEYARACIKAEISQATVIPHPAQVAEVMQILRQCFNQLESIKQKDGKSWLRISRTSENVETVLNEIQISIASAFRQPQSLKQLIEEAIQRNPETILLLQSILKEYGNH